MYYLYHIPGKKIDFVKLCYDKEMLEVPKPEKLIDFADVYVCCKEEVSDNVFEYSWTKEECKGYKKGKVEASVCGANDVYCSAVCESKGYTHELTISNPDGTEWAVDGVVSPYADAPYGYCYCTDFNINNDNCMTIRQIELIGLQQQWKDLDIKFLTKPKADFPNEPGALTSDFIQDIASFSAEAGYSYSTDTTTGVIIIG